MQAGGKQHDHEDQHTGQHRKPMHQRVNGESATNYRRSVQSYEIPDVTLMDMNGAQVSLTSALNADSPTMLNFIFTSCTTICPVLSATFSQAQKKLQSRREKFRMISISIDPEHDTPARLKAYAKKHNAGPQWNFFTGTLSDIVAVQKAFDAYRGNKMSHEPLTLMRASADGSWVRLDGFTSTADLVAEYRRALVE